MNTTIVKSPEVRPRSVVMDMAERFQMDPLAFEATLRATVVPKECSKEEFAAFLLVARDYGLNPITKEIFAFPKRGGGIQPIVSVDGWISLTNRQPSFDGMEFADQADSSGRLTAITCKIYRKDRSRHIEVTEYMSECARDTDTWKKWPARMLRHKSLIQCARIAFGFSGLQDPDEFERGDGVIIDQPAPARPSRNDAPKAAPVEETPAQEFQFEFTQPDGEVVPLTAELFAKALTNGIEKVLSVKDLDALWENNSPQLSHLPEGDAMAIRDAHDARMIDLNKPKESPIAGFLKFLENCKTIKALNTLVATNGDTIKALAESDPASYDQLQLAIKAASDRLSEKAKT